MMVLSIVKMTLFIKIKHSMRKRSHILYRTTRLSLTRLKNWQNKIISKLMQILNKKTPKSRNRDGSKRTYRKLIETVFDIDITRVERTPDENEVSFKWCDYSIASINSLIRQGVTDTLKELVKGSVQSNNHEKSKLVAEVELFINSVEHERQDKHLDEYHATLLKDEAKSLIFI